MAGSMAFTPSFCRGCNGLEYSEAGGTVLPRPPRRGDAARIKIETGVSSALLKDKPSFPALEFDLPPCFFTLTSLGISPNLLGNEFHGFAQLCRVRRGEVEKREPWWSRARKLAVSENSAVKSSTAVHRRGRASGTRSSQHTGQLDHARHRAETNPPMRLTPLMPFHRHPAHGLP